MADNKLNTIGLIVMGPCGCGKSKVGSAVAKYYNCLFLDGDELHPEENILKMQNGIPLTDDDRIPWLKKVRNVMIKKCETNSKSDNLAVDDQGDEMKPKNINIGIVAACSALKKSYRNILYGISNDLAVEDIHTKVKIVFLFLKCSREVLEQRLANRSGHFMKLGMLDSQLNALQSPDESETSYFVTVNGDLELADVLVETIEKLDKFGVCKN